MSDNGPNGGQIAWKRLKELMQVTRTVSDVYVRVDLLGGHYMRVSSEDFLEAIKDMRAASQTHPHPVQFRFTVDSGIVWVHESLEPKAVRDRNKQASPEKIVPPPPAGYLRSHRTSGALQFSVSPLTEAEKAAGWIERPFWTAPPTGAERQPEKAAPDREKPRPARASAPDPTDRSHVK